MSRTIPLISKTCFVNSRTFSRVTIKRAYIQVIMGIKEKRLMFSKKSQFFIEIAHHTSFLKESLVNYKMPHSSTAADRPLARSIHPKLQSRQMHVISLYLYNNAAIICFSHHA